MFESYDNVYNFWFVNGASSVTFLEYDDGLIAFDSSLYPRKFEDMVKIVEERTSKKLKKVFFTHFHPDHTFGAVFSKRKFDLYMNKKTLDFLNTLDATFLKESSKIADYNFNNFKEALREKDIVIFENSIFLLLRDQILSAENIGGHTLDSTIYILKPQGYLISGDLVFSKVHAEILNSNVDEWISRLNNLSSLDIETVFPGHGKPESKKVLKEQLTYLKRKKNGENLEKRYADYSLSDLAHL
ncbi:MULTISPECIES: MBL fold metallo-hydrolase [Petrotoga]|uniref:Glyoxylase-like metal-dependent hydrolase (Beta-lactamase superfamily II) n=2 Tax=Petrotoga sibirica TaxID=156202 RepID=A0A4R8EUL2_9BACT|nr:MULTISPECIES: MBL fold metallo-hydrolase [Petrotoga]KUK83539.1 MAG: Beta-lactamase domain protein [Petrotoga mobilis]POZ89464.1 hypothetical protein AA80_00500 [Petrotoga sibirica DSM 13575]POZ91906.1 hypothetical protein AD60_00500 [Petrotoga sp. SL27]TDX16272.1 glyoxylase-like metal-dependent hydrolase (beta-lactamase superfamily II) [Petrotoga sibirica]